MSKTRLAVAAVAAGLLALTACSPEEPKSTNSSSSNENSEEKKDESPVENASDKKKPEHTADELKAAWAEIDLGSADIGYGVKRMQHDDDMAAKTNDICGRNWKSNNNRIARDQGYFWADGDSLPLVSNEAVAYKPGTGADALAELRQAVGGCDGWKHEQGEMDSVHSIDVPAGATKESFAWAGVDIRGGDEMYYAAVYLRQSDLISAVYVWSDDEGELQEVLGAVVPKAAELLKNSL